MLSTNFQNQLEHIDSSLLEVDFNIADLAYPIMRKRLSLNFHSTPIYCTTDTLVLLQKLNVDVVSFVLTMLLTLVKKA